MENMLRIRYQVKKDHEIIKLVKEVIELVNKINKLVELNNLEDNLSEAELDERIKLIENLQKEINNFSKYSLEDYWDHKNNPEAKYWINFSVDKSGKIQWVDK